MFKYNAVEYLQNLRILPRKNLNSVQELVEKRFLAVLDLFDMFTQSIKLYIFYCSSLSVSLSPSPSLSSFYGHLNKFKYLILCEAIKQIQVFFIKNFGNDFSNLICYCVCE